MLLQIITIKQVYSLLNAYIFTTNKTYLLLNHLLIPFHCTDRGNSNSNPILNSNPDSKSNPNPKVNLAQILSIKFNDGGVGVDTLTLYLNMSVYILKDMTHIDFTSH